MNTLAARDKQLLHKAFNNGGYVLDFTDATFENFTLTSVGIDVKAKYQKSKGAALDDFFSLEDDRLIGKMINDLIQHRNDMALFGTSQIDANEGVLLKECARIAERLTASPAASQQANMIMNSSFSSPYINQQVNLMYDAIDKGNSTEAIGKAKELVESCAKTILEQRDVPFTKADDYTTLVNAALKELKLKRESVPDDKKASETIKKILSSLTQSVLGIAELRNSYGSGHGKTNDYTGLSKRHARLAVGSAATATIFMWDTHCAMGKDDKTTR